MDRDLFELSQRRPVDFYRDADQVHEELNPLTALIDMLELEPADSDAKVAPVEERITVKKPTPGSSLTEQKARLEMIVLPIISFCLYAWLLADQIDTVVALLLAAFAGSLAGIALVKLLFNDGGRGSVLLLVLCLLALAPALPESIKQHLPAFLSQSE